MKGGKCCKCNGGRGAWLTSCYDSPMNCCGLKASTKKRYIKEYEQLKIRSKERRKRNFKNNTRRKLKKISKKFKSMTKKLKNVFK